MQAVFAANLPGTRLYRHGRSAANRDVMEVVGAGAIIEAHAQDGMIVPVNLGGNL